MTSDYTANDIRAALEELGVGPGCIVFSHSNIGFFGRLEGAQGGEDYCETFLDAFLDVIGPQGTLVVPAFTYSYCNGEPYKPESTESVCGAFSEHVRCDPRSVRSWDGNFSVSAIGALAEALTANPPDHSFGSDSFWDRFLSEEGLVVNLNFDAGSTFLHYVERELKVPYRYDKGFPGVTITAEDRVERTFYHFVYDKEKPADAPDFEAFDQAASQAGIVSRSDLGRGQLVAVPARETFGFLEEALEEMPRLLTKGA